MNAPLNLLKEKNERMKQCPQCDTGYPDSHATCPTHGVLLNEIRDLKPGMLIHKTYRIVRKLGQGGMGAVYLAQHIFMEEPRALKFLSAELSQDEAFTGRFRREVRTLRQLALRQRSRVGRLVVAPDLPSSLKSVLHPARFKAANCKAALWSSVDTRA
jgi:serine/threonine protein kinase